METILGINTDPSTTEGALKKINSIPSKRVQLLRIMATKSNYLTASVRICSSNLQFASSS